MCGIAGYVSYQRRAKADELFKMLSAFAHRGPDGFSGFIEGGVALGSARLSIVDREGGTQPAVRPDRKVAVIFNGEIFNYQEQRRILQERGISLTTNSEVEALLHLYITFGDDFIERLNGQFAIAIWDGRDNSLKLFRDRVGIRPLFWKQTEGRLLFGSEIKSIMAVDGALALNRRAIVQAFQLWTTVGDTSAFEDVSQIPPGHMGVFKNGQVRIRRYWSWPFASDVEPLHLQSDGEYFEAFRDQLETSIARRRMADVPVASYLSGGIDSSVIALGLKMQLGDTPLKTYSIAFSDQEYDESAAQRLVAEHIGVEHNTVTIDSNQIGESFPQVVWQAETPLFRSAPVPLFHLSRKVHADGIKVVMTGEGADEVLLGYDLFRETLIRRFWGRRPESTWRGALLRRLYAYLPQYRNPRYISMVMDFYRPFLEDKGDLHYAMAVRWMNSAALAPYFSADMQAYAMAHDPIADLNATLPAEYARANDIERGQCIEAQGLMANYLLSSQGDRMSMAHAVEGRYPFLDHEFIEFAARLPQNIKLRGMKDKFILRRAYADQLPETVWNRPKVAYQAPDVKGFFIDGKAQDYVEELLAPDQIRAVGLFDPDRVSQLVKKARGYNLSRVGVRDNMALVLILSTMLLDALYVRQTMSCTSDVDIPDKLNLV